MTLKSDLDLFFAIEGKSFNRKTNLKQYSENDYDYEEDSNDVNIYEYNDNSNNDNNQEDKLNKKFPMKSNLKEYETNFPSNSKSDDNDEKLFDDILIPEINLNLIQFDENGSIINADDVVQIQEDDLLQSLNLIYLTQEDEEKIKRQVDAEFGDEGQTCLLRASINNNEQKYRTERQNIERKIKQKEEESKLILELKSLFERLKESNLAQQTKEPDLLKQIKDSNQKNLEKIDEINQEISRLEALIHDFDETESEDNLPNKETKIMFLNRIQQILNLFVNLNIWLFNCGQPPMDGCNITDKSIDEIDSILKKMIERTKIATKTIIP